MRQSKNQFRVPSRLKPAADVVSFAAGIRSRYARLSNQLGTSRELLFTKRLKIPTRRFETIRIVPLQRPMLLQRQTVRIFATTHETHNLHRRSDGVSVRHPKLVREIISRLAPQRKTVPDQLVQRIAARGARIAQAGGRRAPIIASPPLPSARLVFRKPSVTLAEEHNPQRSSNTKSPPPSGSRASQQSLQNFNEIEVERLTTQIMRHIDRRVIAQRERFGQA